MDIPAIRRAMASGLDGLGYTIYPTDATPIDPPAITIGLPQQVRPNQTLNTDGLTIAVKVYIPMGDDDTAYEDMDTALSTGITGSVIDALRGLTSTAWRGKLLVPLADQFNLVAAEDGGAHLTATLFVQLLA